MPSQPPGARLAPPPALLVVAGCITFLIGSFGEAARAAPEGEEAGEAIASGQTISARLASGSRRYLFTAPEPGYLTIVALGRDPEPVASPPRPRGDLLLTVIDPAGEPVPGARSDNDFDEDRSSERLLVLLSEAGRYTVVVELYAESEPVSYDLAVGFVPFPRAARPLDRDRAPSGARAIAVGEDIVDQFDSVQGDHVDWFRVPVAENGILRVSTRGEGHGSGDIALSVSRADAPHEPIGRSDRDLEGALLDEEVSVAVEPGDHLIRVEHRGRGACAYRLRTSFSVASPERE